MRLLDLGIDSSLRNRSGKAAIDILLNLRFIKCKDGELPGALEGFLQMIRPWDAAKRLLNERKIIQTLIDIEDLHRA